MASTQSIDPKSWRKLIRGLKEDPKFVNFLTRGDGLENLARVRRSHQDEFDTNPPDGIARGKRPKGVGKRKYNWPEGN